MSVSTILIPADLFHMIHSEFGDPKGSKMWRIQRGSYSHACLSDLVTEYRTPVPGLSDLEGRLCVLVQAYGSGSSEVKADIKGMIIKMNISVHGLQTDRWYAWSSNLQLDIRGPKTSIQKFQVSKYLADYGVVWVKYYCLFVFISIDHHVLRSLSSFCAQRGKFSWHFYMVA